MQVRIVTVGDELLLGQISNSNATWIARQLSLIQVVPEDISVIADTKEAITEMLDRFWPESDLIIITGGLGPTPDDITKAAVADYFGLQLEFDADVHETIADRLEARGIPVADINRKLAMVPAGFEVLSNRSGTAPGLWYERGERALVLLPGVPFEMQALMTDHVLPRVEERTDTAHTYRVLRTAGVPESTLQEELNDLDEYVDDTISVAFLPEAGGVRLRLTAAGDDRDQLERRLDRLQAYIQDRLGNHLYSTEDETIEAVVGQLLKEKSFTIAGAESCTGGAVMERLIDVPGASDYVEGGIVAYSNRLKVDLLGVSSEALEEEGAVSSIVARQMAEGIRERLHTDIGVATTGVAGPTGGTPEKPVGTVWIGYADEEGVKAHRLSLSHDRLVNKELSVIAVLDMVRRRLIGRPEIV